MNSIDAQFADIKPKIDGEMLVIKPSPHALQMISIIQDVVSQAMQNEGITTWTPIPLEKAHFTLFAGLTDLTSRERLFLMKRVKKEMSSCPPFELKIKMNEQINDGSAVRKTSVKRGPYKWITLGVAQDQLQEIRDKVKKAISDAIIAEEIDPTKVDLDKFHKHNGTHITLGVLDIDDNQYHGLAIDDPQQHEDVKKLNDIANRIAFGAFLAESFRGCSFTSLVQTIKLIGIENLYASTIHEKKYHQLASCSIGSPVPVMDPGMTFISSRFPALDSVIQPTIQKPLPSIKQAKSFAEMTSARVDFPPLGSTSHFSTHRSVGNPFKMQTKTFAQVVSK